MSPHIPTPPAFYDTTITYVGIRAGLVSVCIRDALFCWRWNECVPHVRPHASKGLLRHVLCCSCHLSAKHGVGNGTIGRSFTWFWWDNAGEAKTCATFAVTDSSIPNVGALSLQYGIQSVPGTVRKCRFCGQNWIVAERTRSAPDLASLENDVNIRGGFKLLPEDLNGGASLHSLGYQGNTELLTVAMSPTYILQNNLHTCSSL